MLKIRLQRTGRTNDPYFRAVLTDSKNATRSGKFIKVLGSYNPKKGEVSLKNDEIKEWISKGAQVSGTLHNFLVKEGVLSSKKVNVLPKKSVTVKRKEAKGAK